MLNTAPEGEQLVNWYLNLMGGGYRACQYWWQNCKGSACANAPSCEDDWVLQGAADAGCLGNCGQVSEMRPSGLVPGMRRCGHGVRHRSERNCALPQLGAGVPTGHHVRLRGVTTCAPAWRVSARVTRRAGSPALRRDDRLAVWRILPTKAPTPQNAPPQTSKKGFPVWLIIVLVLISAVVLFGGTLAALAVFGFRNYMSAAKSAEAKATVGRHLSERRRSLRA